MFGRLSIWVGKRVSTDMRLSTQKMLDFAGDETAPEIWVADMFLLSLIVAVLSSVLFYALSMYVFDRYMEFVMARYSLLTVAVVFMIMFVLTSLVRYLLISFRIDDRKRRCQEILPDFLSVVAMNLSAGMEPLTALYVSLRPDYNPITDEMKNIRSLSLGSKSMVEQLALLTMKIDSSSLRTAVAIIERASMAGGDLASLLDSVSLDLRENNKIQKELEAATRGYVTFIAFLALLGVPLLLSVATLFLSMITVPNIAGGLTSMLSINLAGQSIPPAQIEILFLVLMSFSSISASFIFSVLWRGDVKQGVKYVPIMVPLSLIVFYTCKLTLKSVLGSFVGFGEFG